MTAALLAAQEDDVEKLKAALHGVKVKYWMDWRTTGDEHQEGKHTDCIRIDGASRVQSCQLA